LVELPFGGIKAAISPLTKEGGREDVDDETRRGDVNEPNCGANEEDETGKERMTGRELPRKM